MDAELLGAISNLLGPVAWPIVALVGMVVFRGELRGLIGRVRRAAGFEFSRSAAQAPTAPTTAGTLIEAGNVQAGGAAEPTDLPPLSPTATALIPQLRATPLFQNATDVQRIERLLHTVAFLAFSADAERVEGQIWASQVALLEYLNAADAGDTLANLKSRFYDPAVAGFPQLFANYAFEPYFGFLRINGFIELEGDRARITQKGRDYLAWRVQARKPPRLVG